MQIPSQEVQTIAETYVLERPLTRPDTNVKKVVVCCILYVNFTAGFSYAFLRLFDWLGIFALLPDNIPEFRLNHPTWFIIIFVFCSFCFTGLLFSKTAAIGCIKLYQHYAPEEIRRRCLFMPTCSEYAILAIRKYGLIIGLIKTYVRLFKKCRGNIYRIDYP